MRRNSIFSNPNLAHAIIITAQQLFEHIEFERLRRIEDEELELDETTGTYKPQQSTP